MTDSRPIPPPPPLGAEPPIGTSRDDAGRAAWEHEIDRALARMTESLTEAIERHDAGAIGLSEFQQRCLDAGAARIGNTLLLWDWVNGRVFAYDGFEMVELTEPEP